MWALRPSRQGGKALSAETLGLPLNFASQVVYLHLEATHRRRCRFSITRETDMHGLRAISRGKVQKFAFRDERRCMRPFWQVRELDYCHIGPVGEHCWDSLPPCAALYALALVWFLVLGG